jgi:protein-tyrosine sulfotransferase
MVTQDLKIKKAPVFLIGCHRSGTTLARTLLGAHPDLACPPETKFIAGLRAFIEFPQVTAALTECGFTAQDMYKKIRAFTESFFNEYTQRKGKRRWIDKTPNYAYHLDLIDEIFNWECQFLFITRHPFDTIVSLERWGRGAVLISDPDLDRHFSVHGTGRLSLARYWTDINERLLTFASSYPERSLLFKYEELVSDTPGMLRKILTSIGEDFDPEMVTRAFNGNHKKAELYADASIRASTTVRQDRVDKWKTWSIGEQRALWRVVGPTASLLGYEAP